MNVTVYTTPTCMYCHQLKRFLEKKEVEYEEINVFRDQEAARKVAQETGRMSVPITKIDDHYVLGFAKDTITELLGI